MQRNFFSEQAREAGEQGEVILELPEISDDQIEAAIGSYPATDAGFLSLCSDISNSQNPQTVPVIIYLEKNQWEIERIFGREAVYGPDMELADAKDAFLKKNGHLVPMYINALLDSEIKVAEGFATKDIGMDFVTGDNPDLDEVQPYGWYRDYAQQVAANYVVASEGIEFIDDALEFDQSFDSLSKDQINVLGEKMIHLLVTERGTYHHRLYDFLSQRCPEHATQYCLSLTKSAPRDRASVYLGIIARLNPGRVFVRDDQIEYLGQTINLEGETENLAEVRRLSIDGTVAAFDEEQRVQGIFSLQELDMSNWDDLKVVIREMGMGDLFFDDVDADITPQQQTEILRQFREQYTDFANHSFFVDLEISPHVLSLKEQAWMMHIFKTADNESLDKMKRYVHVNGVDGLRACAANFVYTGSIDRLYDLYQNAGAAVSGGVVDSFLDYLDEQMVMAHDVKTSLTNAYPDLDITADEILRGLMVEAVRGIDSALEKVNDSIAAEENIAGFFGPEIESDYKEQLRTTAIDVALGVSVFKELLQLTQRDSINLLAHARRQQALVVLLENPSLKPLLVDALVQRGDLQPIPEIHWRVDRTMEEYSRRFGIDMERFTQDMAAADAKPTVLELGPGSGHAKAERQRIANSVELSLTNTVYYSLGEYAKNLLDFESIEAATGEPLTADERAVIGDVLYKMMVIESGQEDSDTFAYNESTMSGIQEDPGNVRTHLLAAMQRINEVAMVPDTISSRTPDGQVIYPNKIVFAEQTSGVQAALKVLQQEPDAHLVESGNDLTHVPVHPEGMVLGNFSEIEKVNDEQVDYAFGVRSTVYEREEAWSHFGSEMATKLKDGGIWIDDSLRDNDGYRYRIAELLAMREQIDDPNVHIAIMLGPGFPKEDHVQAEDGRVPMALVMTRGREPLDVVGGYMMDGYELVEINDVANNTEYLRSLTERGELVDEVAAAQSRLAA